MDSLKNLKIGKKLPKTLDINNPIPKVSEVVTGKNAKGFLDAGVKMAKIDLKNPLPQVPKIGDAVKNLKSDLKLPECMEAKQVKKTIKKVAKQTDKKSFLTKVMKKCKIGD